MPGDYISVWATDHEKKFVLYFHSAYFLELMQALRTSISKLVVISTLWVGFGLYLAQPAAGKSTPDAINNLLNEVAKKANNASLYKELAALDKVDANEDELAQELSALFAKYKLDQHVPSKQELGSKKLYRLLLKQWNYLASANGMSKAPLTETLKPAKILQVDKFGTTGQAGIFANTFPSFLEKSTAAFHFADLFDRSLIPMECGMAIGAP